MEARKRSNQAVDAREADPRLKSTKPRSRHLRSLAALAVCGFLTVTALLTVPRQAQAQAQILVSNVGKTTDSNGSLADFDQAQAFTTGMNSAGYTLTSVEIDMEAHAEDAAAFTVRIHSSNSTFVPGRRLGTLSKPASLSGERVYAFTTRGIDLAADTTYFVVIDRTGSVTNNLYIEPLAKSVFGRVFA